MKSYSEMRIEAEEHYRQYLEEEALVKKRIEDFYQYLAGYLWGKLDVPEEDKGYVTLDLGNFNGTATFVIHYPDCVAIHLKLTISIKNDDMKTGRIATKSNVLELAKRGDFVISKVNQDQWRIPERGAQRKTLSEAVVTAYRVEQEYLSKSRQNNGLPL